MLKDQVTGQHKRRDMLIGRPRGKAVMLGPRDVKDTKERSLMYREREQDLITIFREGTVSIYLDFWSCVGVTERGNF